jgi:hypothetical protein
MYVSCSKFLSFGMLSTPPDIEGGGKVPEDRWNEIAVVI